MVSHRIFVSDVTMKFADAGTGPAISFRRKIELAKQLDRLGVDVVETGVLQGGKSGSLLVKSLASAVSGSVLAVPVDPSDPASPETVWEALKEAAKPRMQVILPVSTVQMEYLMHKKAPQILELVKSLVSRCASLCPDTEFLAEDFGRCEPAFLKQVILAAAESGATTISVRDAAGDLLPEEFQNSVRELRAIIPEGMRLGVWCSNTMFLADACAVAAVREGADEIKVSACCNAGVSLKRFVNILKAREDACGASCRVPTTELDRATARIKQLCETSRHAVPATADGAAEEIRFSVHDDREAVMRQVARLGYDLSEEDSLNVYDAFVRLASKNGSIEAKELDAIVASVAFQAPAAYKLDSYVINSGNVISATCHLRLRKDERLLESVCVGDGPVDAAFLAIEKLVDRSYELDDFQIQSVTEGREAMGEAVVRLRSGGKLVSGRGISTDIVGSSIMAYLNAVNKIVYEEDGV